jgi:hypothetical protein
MRIKPEIGNFVLALFPTLDSALALIPALDCALDSAPALILAPDCRRVEAVDQSLLASQAVAFLFARLCKLSLQRDQRPRD